MQIRDNKSQENVIHLCHLNAMFFCAPSSILMAGPSGSGKTAFVSKLLQNPSQCFQRLPLNLHYCYGIF